MKDKNNLLKKSTQLFIATMVANVCNFLFQLYMGRKLSQEDFGILNSLLSFFLILSVPTITIQIVIAKYVSKFKVSDEFEKIKFLIVKTIKNAIIYIAIGLILFFPGSKPIALFLQIDSVIPVIIVGLILASSFLVPIMTGSLQGLQKFDCFGISICAGGVCRLIFGVLLLWLGLRVNGALSAALLANIAVLAISAYPLLFLSHYKESVAAPGLKKELLSYSLPVMIATFCFNILTNIDLILVKHYFEPDLAGAYSSVVVLGKIVLYLPAVISVVMFPMVSEAHTAESDVFAFLKKSLLYTAGLSLVGLSGFFLFPQFILNLLFGGKFNDAAHLLQIFGLSMFFMTLINVIMNFNLARHNHKFIYSMICGCALQVIFIILFHDTLRQIIFATIASGSVVLFYNFVLIIMEKKQQAASSRQLAVGSD